MKPVVKYFWYKKQINKNKEQNFKQKSYTQWNAMPVGQVTTLSRTAKNNTTYMYLIEKSKL